MSTALSATLVAGGGGADGVGDMLADLVNSEVTINAATTLTSSALGKQHVIEDSGTPADYTVDLPAVSGNGGKLIGIRVDTAATKLFTVDGNGSETIDGSTTIPLRAGESVTLYCNGTAWFIVAARLKPVLARYESNAGQNIDTATTEVIDFEDLVTDTHGAVTTGASWQFTVPTGRAGSYRITATVLYDSTSWATGDHCELHVYKNGSEIASIARPEFQTARTDFPDAMTGSVILDLAEGDTIDLRTAHGNSSAVDLLNDAGWVHVSIEGGMG